MTEKEALIVYNTYKQRLFNSSMRILKNSMDAEEVVQDTILKYVNDNELHALNLTSQQIGAWLHRTCVRASIDLLRKRTSYSGFKERYKEVTEKDENLSGMPTAMNYEIPAQESEQDQLIRKIRDKVMELSDGYRTVLSLILFDGLDYEEVASVLNINISTVRSQFLRAKRKLQALLEQ